MQKDSYDDHWSDGVGPEERARTQGQIRAETGVNSPLWRNAMLWMLLAFGVGVYVWMMLGPL